MLLPTLFKALLPRQNKMTIMLYIYIYTDMSYCIRYTTTVNHTSINTNTNIVIMMMAVAVLQLMHSRLSSVAETLHMTLARMRVVETALPKTKAQVVVAHNPMTGKCCKMIFLYKKGRVLKQLVCGHFSQFQPQIFLCIFIDVVTIIILMSEISLYCYSKGCL